MGSMSSSGSQGGGGRGMADLVVWMGDLNYRIDLARSEVCVCV